MENKIISGNQQLNKLNQELLNFGQDNTQLNKQKDELNLNIERLKNDLTLSQNQIDEFNDKPVNIGDSWKSETTLELGQGTVFEMTSSQKYLGTIQQDGKTLHHVEIKYTEVDFEQPAATPGAAAVTESDLEIIEGTSTLLFDAEKGRIVTSKIHLEVKGEITLTIADMDLPAKLALEITINQTNK